MSTSKKSPAEATSGGVAGARARNAKGIEAPMREPSESLEIVTSAESIAGSPFSSRNGGLHAFRAPV